MAQNTRIGERINAVVRIRLKHRDVNTFVERYSGNISRGGIFIASRTPQPVGSTLAFEFQLAQGEPVIRGEGEVVWVKHYDGSAPDRPHGMGVRFTWLDEQSRSVIDRALAFKDQDRKIGRMPPSLAAREDASRRAQSGELLRPSSSELLRPLQGQGDGDTRRMRRPTAEQLAELTDKFTRLPLDDSDDSPASSTAALVASAMADLTSGELPAHKLTPGVATPSSVSAVEPPSVRASAQAPGRPSITGAPRPLAAPPAFVIASTNESRRTPTAVTAVPPAGMTLDPDFDETDASSDSSDPLDALGVTPERAAATTVALRKSPPTTDEATIAALRRTPR